MFQELRRRITHEPVAIALVASLFVLWLNFLLTSRWEHIDGSINGPKRPLFLIALVTASVLTVRQFWRQPDAGMSETSAKIAAAAGLLFLSACFLTWFPPATWRQIPFLDDWPIRYQSAYDLMRLLDRGSFTGWEWRFLGGYHSSSDATQGLGTLAFFPMRILGPTLGFHVLHVLLFAALPALIWLDLSLDSTEQETSVRWTAVGLVALLSAGYAYTLIRSGDTNSLGGVVMTIAALVGAHAARRGRRWGAVLLMIGVAATAYAHPGFFLYAAGYLILDALLARNAHAALMSIIAVATGIIVSLPLTWESWRYPAFFSFNNLLYTAPSGIDWKAAARNIYYNVELLWLPARWFNDYTGLALVLVPVTSMLAIVDRSRVRFYAVAMLATEVVMRFETIYVGYVFRRPMHMLVVFCAAILAALLVRHTGSARVRWSLAVVVVLYTQVWFHHVPHLRDVRDFNPQLIDRVAAAPGALVLLENNPHRNMNAEPGGATEPSLFGTHFEPLIAERTGRRLYAGGYSDGWQWNPWKGQVVAGGTFMGRSIGATPPDVFVAELQRWGVVDLFVWSAPTKAYLQRDARFITLWSDGTWTQYRLIPSDPRDVATQTGEGVLVQPDAHGAIVQLQNVHLGEAVVVRTNFHPAWTARANGRAINLVQRNGQLSFDAPCTGACIVTLQYPAHRALLPIALLVLMASTIGVSRWDRHHNAGARQVPDTSQTAKT